MQGLNSWRTEMCAFCAPKKQGGLEAHKSIRIANPARLSDEDSGTAEGISLESAR